MPPTGGLPPGLPLGLAEVLAHPREAGTADAERARAQLEARLRALGYQVDHQRFAFPPSALNGFPVFGAGMGWLALLLLPLLTHRPLPAWAALTVLSAGLLALGVVAWGIGMGYTALGGGMREDANLVAVRPGVPVRRWIVAHLDTKAQGHSMAGRLVAVWALVAAGLLLLGLATARLWGTVPVAAAGAGAAAALVAGFLAGRGRLRGGTVGARDNGSGLVAAFAAAEAGLEPGTGVLITGAEEFGLVGARVFARDRAALLRGTEVVNLDTLDDEGPLFLVSHDAAGGAVAQRLQGQLEGLALPLRLRRLPLGIFVDSHPLAQGGAAAVTLGRLTWATLRRLHTVRDDAEGLAFDTALRVGRALARI